MAKVRMGLVGIGKIARDQHIPVIAANPDFELVACASRNHRVDGVANFKTVEEMLAGCPQLDAVVITTPPQVHYEAAKRALLAGKHVFMEKPPCATTAQLDQLATLARSVQRTFFQTWHLRHAPRVADAKHWLKTRNVQGGRVIWKEDVRYWHPGQTWIWQPGGYGVFDPGINALSIMTEILPEPLFVYEAELFFPENCDSPIAANLAFRTDSGAEIQAEFDFLYEEKARWDIVLETNGGTMALTSAATVLSINGEKMEFPLHADEEYAEYAPLYRHFAELIAAGQSDVDATPFRLVSDTFLVGKRTVVSRFDE